MTDSKTYSVQGADITVTVSVYAQSVDVNITVDTSKLDAGLPDHSPHSLLRNYLNIAHYSTRQSYWWDHCYYKITVKTVSQANRVIKSQLAKIDDAIYQALQIRKSRMEEINNVFA